MLVLICVWFISTLVLASLGLLGSAFRGFGLSVGLSVLKFELATRLSVSGPESPTTEPEWAVDWPSVTVPESLVTDFELAIGLLVSIFVLATSGPSVTDLFWFRPYH